MILHFNDISSEISITLRIRQIKLQYDDKISFLELLLPDFLELV
jgi:hypothetical protein